MLAKFIIIAFTAEVLLSENTALASCVNPPGPHWVKFNKSPVCFGASGNSFGKFIYDRNIIVSWFMLVHRSGSVTCNKRLPRYSYWGCTADTKSLSVIRVWSSGLKQPAPSLAPSQTLQVPSRKASLRALRDDPNNGCEGD